jgi:hypothetical protein
MLIIEKYKQFFKPVQKEEKPDKNINPKELKIIKN